MREIVKRWVSRKRVKMRPYGIKYRDWDLVYCSENMYHCCVGKKARSQDDKINLRSRKKTERQSAKKNIEKELETI